MPTRVAADACAEMVANVAARCSAPLPVAAGPPSPPALATDFGALATAIAFGSLVIMVLTLVVVAVGIIVAVRWGQIVIAEAKEDARKAVREEMPNVAKSEVERVAPGLLADYMAELVIADDGTTADEQAEDLGGEPR